MNSKHVLIADDEPNIVVSLEFLMKREGHRVTVARDGDAALAAIRAERPDLVLLDVMMPGGDGREAYRELRARADLPDVPVVMMSAAVRPDGLDPSIAAFLRKPFDLDHLLALVAGLIGSSHVGGIA
jgi:DNA-binding response OmpR family regulator